MFTYLVSKPNSDVFVPKVNQITLFAQLFSSRSNWFFRRRLGQMDGSTKHRTFPQEIRAQVQCETSGSSWFLRKPCTCLNPTKALCLHNCPDCAG